MITINGLAAVRSELARQLWLARRGALDLIEAQASVRGLVASCPDHTLAMADLLEHAVKTQLQKILGNHYYRQRGLSSMSRVVAIKTRKEFVVGKN